MIGQCSWNSRGWCRAERIAGRDKWKVSVLSPVETFEHLKPEGVCSRRQKSLLTLTSACSLLISGGPEWVSAWPSEGKVTVREDPECIGVIETP